ncbi:MAG: hypothetical protein UY31_C0048G0004 [Candidatus Wolfebacteria bacterium GW2011_GWE1_48_7]|nr:MAG: hypothetical protein UY31_C0048G0004 [Candidatus Wolfebacteria bacterium GW2011_GWE1_48_7]
MEGDKVPSNDRALPDAQPKPSSLRAVFLTNIPFSGTTILAVHFTII